MTVRMLGWLLIGGLAVTTPVLAQEMSPEEIRARINAQIQADKQAGSDGRAMWLNNGQDYNKPLYPNPAPSAQPKPTVSPPPLEFRSIQFGYASDRLTPESLLMIGAIAQALRGPEYARNIFVIVGHTDSRGSDEYNLRLSGRRAMSVVAALRTIGVPVERLRAEGMGERLPSPGIPSDDPANRRVQIVVAQ